MPDPAGANRKGKSAAVVAVAIVGLAGVALASLSLDQGPDRTAHRHGTGAQEAERSGTYSSSSQPDGGQETHAHNHAQKLSIPAGPDAPSLGLEIHRDPAKGWNLRVVVTNFRFSPENAGKAHVPGEGHAHIYVDGLKVARAYSEWYHLDGLPAEATEIAVTLNSNDHRILMVDGREVRTAQGLPEPR